MISLGEVRYEDKVDGEIVWSTSLKNHPQFIECSHPSFHIVFLFIYERIASFFSSVQAKQIIGEMFGMFFGFILKESVKYFLYKLLEFLIILLLCVMLTRSCFFNEKLQLKIKSSSQMCSQTKQA